MKFKSLITAGAVAFLFIATGNAAIAAEEAREVSAFNTVTLGGLGDLTITVGEEHSVVLEGDPRLLEKIETNVERGHLMIKRETRSWFSLNGENYGRLKVRVGVPELEKAMLAGSGNLEVKGLDGGETELAIAGSGHIKAQGGLDVIRLVINGSGEIEAENLEVKDAHVTINGSGDVLLRVAGELEATINGSGDIEYIGEPENVQSSMRGSGRIHQR